MNSRNYKYYGEVDKEGQACGEGHAVSVKLPEFKYVGTFLNNKPHGICKDHQIFSQFLIFTGVNTTILGRFEGEMCHGQWHGKVTLYARE